MALSESGRDLSGAEVAVAGRRAGKAGVGEGGGGGVGCSGLHQLVRRRGAGVGEREVLVEEPGSRGVGCAAAIFKSTGGLVRRQGGFATDSATT